MRSVVEPNRPALVLMFLAFAFAYFLSALVRAITATLAPAFSQTLSLSAGDLGLLAGAYFFGFSLTQLPLGQALDRWGPKRVQLTLLAVACAACLAFASANTLGGLVLSRMAIGVGVSACLMAPLTAFRLALPVEQQLQLNAWMLMTGSFGMLASTLPVYWLEPVVGWRGLFMGIAALFVLSMVLVAWLVPRPATQRRQASPDRNAAPPVGYRQIFSHPRFVQLLPVGLVMYGGMVAVQALWAGPWLTQVAGLGREHAAQGLFIINLAMLVTFFAWGVVSPKLSARGVDSHRLMRWGLALPLVVLPINLWLGSAAGAGMWALWCVSSTFITLSQPLIAQQFETAVAGRALSAYNLVLFVGIFLIQWCIGLMIDALQGWGWDPTSAFRGAFAAFGLMSLFSYGWYLWREHVIGMKKPQPVRDNATMTQLIIVAHAPLASALKAVAQHAFPELAPTIAVIDVESDEAPEGVTTRLRACLPAGVSALILVDAMGATPCNAAQPLAREGEVSIVAGVSVPMLWRALCYAHEPLAARTQRALDGAVGGAVIVSPLSKP